MFASDSAGVIMDSEAGGITLVAGRDRRSRGALDVAC